MGLLDVDAGLVVGGQEDIVRNHSTVARN